VCWQDDMRDQGWSRCQRARSARVPATSVRAANDVIAPGRNLESALVVSVLFAFAAAFTNALNVVTQHVASTAAPVKDRGRRLALYLIRNPLWLFGVAAMIGSFVFQALALYNGRLSVVQSVLVTELVFSLVIGSFWLRRHVAAAAWVSASVTAAGLAVFLIMAEPRGGHPQATTQAWLPALLTCGGLAALLTVLASRGSPVRRAALYAAAAGIVWATLATLLKSATDVLAGHGAPAVLANGAAYGVVVAGIAGTVLSQAALHRGPLAVSQSLMVIVDPVVSIILGVWLYGEHFVGGPLQISLGAVGFAAMVVGVVFLAATAPSFAATPDTQSAAAP
jgi:drug/metabolite transporter (DMT)-like permease